MSASADIAAQLENLGRITETPLTENQKLILDEMNLIFDKVADPDFKLEDIKLESLKEIMGKFDDGTYDIDKLAAVNAFTAEIKQRGETSEYITSIIDLFTNLQDSIECVVCSLDFNDTDRKRLSPCQTFKIHYLCLTCYRLIKSKPENDSCPTCRNTMTDLYMPLLPPLPSMSDYNDTKLIAYMNYIGWKVVFEQNIGRTIKALNFTRNVENAQGRNVDYLNVENAASDLISTMNNISKVDDSLKAYFTVAKLDKKYIKNDILSCIIKYLRRLRVTKDETKETVNKILSRVFAPTVVWDELQSFDQFYTTYSKPIKNISIQKIELAICRYIVSSGLADSSIIPPDINTFKWINQQNADKKKLNLEYVKPFQKIFVNVMDDRYVDILEFIGFSAEFLQVTKADKDGRINYAAGLEKLEKYYNKKIANIETTFDRLCKMQGIETTLPFSLPEFKKIKSSMFMALNVCLQFHYILDKYSLMGIDNVQTENVKPKVDRENKKVNFTGEEKSLMNEVKSTFVNLGVMQNTWQGGGLGKTGARLAIAAGLATIVASAFLQ